MECWYPFHPAFYSLNIFGAYICGCCGLIIDSGPRVQALLYSLRVRRRQYNHSQSHTSLGSHVFLTAKLTGWLVLTLRFICSSWWKMVGHTEHGRTFWGQGPSVLVPFSSSTQSCCSGNIYGLAVLLMLACLWDIPEPFENRTICQHQERLWAAVWPAIDKGLSFPKQAGWPGWLTSSSLCGNFKIRVLT